MEADCAEGGKAKVIWARDMGPEQNQELLKYYSDRQVWLAEPDETRPKVSPYTTPILESQLTELDSNAAD